MCRIGLPGCRVWAATRGVVVRRVDELFSSVSVSASLASCGTLTGSSLDSTLRAGDVPGAGRFAAGGAGGVRQRPRGHSPPGSQGSLPGRGPEEGEGRSSGCSRWVGLPWSLAFRFFLSVLTVLGTHPGTRRRKERATPVTPLTSDSREPPSPPSDEALNNGPRCYQNETVRSGVTDVNRSFI